MKRQIYSQSILQQLFLHYPHSPIRQQICDIHHSLSISITVYHTPSNSITIFFKLPRPKCLPFSSQAPTRVSTYLCLNTKDITLLITSSSPRHRQRLCKTVSLPPQHHRHRHSPRPRRCRFQGSQLPPHSPRQQTHRCQSRKQIRAQRR